jgi:DNA-binding PadR family transcriptional regulator
MSLAHALLTALLERPCSGSELAARFDRSIGFFWPATHQQIYRELAQLEASGWVASTAVADAPGRKREYQVLPSGLDELKNWVATPREPKAIRDELLVKVRAAAVLGDADLLQSVKLRLERHRARLAIYETIEARDFAIESPSREDRLRRLILNAGMEVEMLWIRLCTEAIEIIGESPKNE